MPNIRKKGAAAELEFCHRFSPFFDHPLKRNLNQTREGGSDVEGSFPFCIEIKRVEDTSQGNKNSWWRQVTACVREGEIATVAFRPGRSPWRFLMPTSLLGIDCDGYLEVSEETWLKYVIKIKEEFPPF